jgi:translation initiation factor 5A
MADDGPADEEFASTDSGASETYPMEGGQIRKGGYIMIKGHPCKVSDVSTSKTGKHGHAKCHFVAIDIFTGKKMEDLVPASHTTAVPFVKKEEFQALDVDDDGFLTVLTADGDTRADLKLPDTMNPEPPGAMELSNKIKELLKEEKDFYVIVQSACNHQQIMDTKIMTN